MRNLKKVLSVLLVVVIMATAMVPAFAAETFNYSTQARALYDLGLFNGVSTTEYAPDLGSALNREQGFKLILSLLGKADDAKALTAADADAALAAFGDAKDVEPSLKNYVAYAVKNGLVIGDTSKLLNAKGAMLGKDFATILLRQLGYADTEFAYDTATATLAEKGGLSTTDVAKFASKELIRDDAVGMMFAALQAKYKTGETVVAQLVASKDVDEAKAIAAGVYVKPVAAALSVKATGAKKITAEFGTAVDLTKATYTVKKGSIAWNIAATTPATDNKSVVIELSGKLSAGVYEVSVAGVSENALTATVTAEDEKVAKIAFTSDKALIKRTAPATAETLVSDPKTVTASYKIYNQYNEDVTTAYWNQPEMSYSGSYSVDSTVKGKLSVTAGTDFKVGDKVTFTALHSSTGTFVSQVLTVSDKADITDVEISSLYNADGKTLGVTAAAGDFKLVFNAKDQYGSSVTSTAIAKEDIIVTSSDNSIIDVQRVGNVPSFETSTTVVKDTTKLVLPLAAPLKAGTVKITAISAKSGKVATFDVVVKDRTKVDTITFEAPEIAIAGTKIYIPFTAVDQFGNQITNTADLSVGSATTDDLTSLTTSAGTLAFEQDYVNGKAKLALTGITAKKTVVITAVTKTNKTAQITINVVAPSTPAVVSGVTSSVKPAILANETQTIKKSYLVVKDQYGKDYSDYVLGNNKDEYRITVKSSANDYVSVTGGDGTVTGTTYYSVGASISLKGVKKGSATITIGLQKNTETSTSPSVLEWKDVIGSEYTYTAKTVELADIKSYSVADITTPVYNVSNAFYAVGAVDNGGATATTNKTDSHAVALKVTGTLEDGSTVTIPVNSTYVDISVSSTSLLAAPIQNSAYMLIGVNAAQSVFGTDKTEKDAVYVVTVKGANGAETFVKTVKVSNVTPEIASVAFRAEADMPLAYRVGGVSTGDLNLKVESDSVVSVVYSLADTKSEIDTFVNDIIKVTDQYGKVIRDSYTSTARMTSAYAVDSNNVIVSAIKNEKGESTKEVVSGGVTTKVAYTVADLAVGFTYNVTVVTDNGKVWSFKVIFK